MNELMHLENADSGALATVARETTEIQSQIAIAKRFPRDEAAAFTKAIKSFTRPAMAEAATYAFPRGGQTIEGPSVDTAREIARCWGNVRYGLRIVEMTRDAVQDCDVVKIKGFAHDLEANNYIEVEDSFRALIQRKNKQTGQTNWVKPDERDFRELVNRRGAICERNALLKILPPDVVDEVLATAKHTQKKAAAGELEQNRDDAIRRLALAYDKLGVSVGMLEERLGHALSLVNETELSELRSTWKAITDGQVKREEAFKASEPVTAPTLKDKLEAKAKTYKLEPKTDNMVIRSRSSDFVGMTLQQVFAEAGEVGLRKIVDMPDAHTAAEIEEAKRALAIATGQTQ